MTGPKLKLFLVLFLIPLVVSRLNQFLLSFIKLNSAWYIYIYTQREAFFVIAGITGLIALLLIGVGIRLFLSLRGKTLGKNGKFSTFGMAIFWMSLGCFWLFEAIYEIVFVISSLEPVINL